MRSVFVLALLSVFLAGPVAAQDVSPKALFFLDLGPGFFQTLSEDTTAAERAGVEQYAGLGWYLSDKVALSARANILQDDMKSTVTSLWGWLMYTPGARIDLSGPYLAFGLGFRFSPPGNDGVITEGMRVGAKGGYQVAMFGEDVMGFLEAEGRYVNEEDVNSVGQVNLGMRGKWGRK